MRRSFVTDHSEISRIFKARAIVAGLFSFLLIGALLTRLGWLQIVEYAHFAGLSKENRVRLMAIPPNRGLIYDRNGVILAENRPTYHLELIPEQIEDMDATLQALGEIVTITEDNIERFHTAMRTHRPFESISLRTRLSEEEVARLSVNRHRFPGVDIEARLSRHYPQGKSTVHAVGYVGRISEKELNVIDVSNYRGTTHIGKTGLEKYYEEELHGIVGQQNVEVNAEGRILRVIDKIPPLPGNNLVLNLDLELQLTAEKALGDFAGAVIVMKPKTGAVLAFVSEPAYDPNLFVHGISVKAYKALREGDYKPLFNRALFGQYPPGSTFKPFLGLAAIDSKAIGYKQAIRCRGFYTLPNDEDHRYRDWKKQGHGTVDLANAIEQSCDVYFYEIANRMGINRMHDYLREFGFGDKTGIDLLGERSGLLPSREWKRRVHNKIWYPGETLIAGIGQGYMLATPLQLAVATSALANKGKKVQPRLLKEMRDTDGEVTAMAVPSVSWIKLGREDRWDHMHKAMHRVLRGKWGTARATGWKLKGYEMAGKTGTAQVFGIAQDEEYDAETVARKLRDHALFIAFAPLEDPEIVVAIIEENGEHGSAVAPIAKAIMDRYLLTEDAEE
ncbi:MAG: penicillin-binding protein 2 [Thiotrichales bacterium]|nr:MAG: penicillin-binding protein 2 [Thiotrichales bacterium]